MPYPHGLRALNHRDFRLFLGGQLVSLVGTWMQSVAQAWFVLELTGSAFKLGVISALQFGPMLFFSIPAGALADRVPKRRMIMATQTALMLQAFALAALCWSGRASYWHVAVLAALYGVANTVDMPVRQAFVVEMAGKEDLPNAIALNSAVFNSARMIGPAAAGLLIARFGVAWAFALNGLSFLAVLLALAAVSAQGLPHPGARGHLAEDVAEGLRYARDTPVVRLVLSVLFFISLLVINNNVMVPLLARQVLHEGAQGLGLLMSALGTGAVLGALAMAWGGRPRLRVLLGAGVAASALTLALAEAGRFWPAMAGLALLGASQIVFMASCNTTVQAEVPDRLRGRVMSLYALVFVGVAPLGSLLMGALAQAFGAPAAYAVGGAGGLLAVLTLAWAWAPSRGPLTSPT
ncbi:MAG: MFS transporter [Elusimicrobia bacterium]|nr:MFS transporter [Elusimicrobiota bacterium]